MCVNQIELDIMNWIGLNVSKQASKQVPPPSFFFFASFFSHHLNLLFCDKYTKWRALCENVLLVFSLLRGVPERPAGGHQEASRRWREVKREGERGREREVDR